MKDGDQIRHPSLGAGTIVAVRTRGGQAGADVDFGYMTDWVPASEFGFDVGSTAPPQGSIANDIVVDAPVTSLLPEVVDARRGVLALKLGQVLEQHVHQLSTAMDGIRAELDAVVARAVQRQARGVLIEGAWGTGKTHLLTMLRAIATSYGMASGSVILDGDGVRFSDPTRLMEAFLESLRYPGEPVPCGIGDRLRQLRRSRVPWSSRFQGAKRIAQAVNVVPERAFDEPEILEILQDYFMLSLSATQARSALAGHGYPRVHLPPLAVRNVKERPGRFCEHLEGWTEFVTQTGAKGLTLIVDEVDVEYASTTGSARPRVVERARRRSLLSALRKGLRKNLPLVVAFGSAPADGEAPEEDDAVRDLVRRVGESELTIIQAPQPDLLHMRHLVQRVIDVYERGYAERLANVEHDQIANLLGTLAKSYMEHAINPVPRALVRTTLEWLDVLPDVLNRKQQLGTG